MVFFFFIYCSNIYQTLAGIKTYSQITVISFVKARSISEKQKSKFKNDGVLDFFNVFKAMIKPVFGNSSMQIKPLNLEHVYT